MISLTLIVCFAVAFGQSLLKEKECTNQDSGDLGRELKELTDKVLQMYIEPQMVKKERVVFSANMEEHYTTKGGDHLIFSEIVVNEGDAYNGTTGTFTCKVPGLYQFNWMIHKTSGTEYTVMYLMQNDNIQFYTHVNTARGNLPGTAYLYVQVDDTVWLKWKESGANLFAMNFSSFSGMLL